MKLIFVLCLCWLAVGCAERQAGRRPDVDMIVEPRFLTGPVKLESCDMKADPPRCRRIRVSYRKGSELLQVRQAQ